MKNMTTDEAGFAQAPLQVGNKVSHNSAPLLLFSNIAGKYWC